MPGKHKKGGFKNPKKYNPKDTSAGKGGKPKIAKMYSPPKNPGRQGK